MKILPYDTSIISTSDSLPIVLQRLNAKVEPRKLFRLSLFTRYAPYEGTISEEGFRINRIITSTRNRNPFLPIIRGRFEVQSHQTLIHLQMSISIFPKAFVIFWYSGWYSILIFDILTGSTPLHMAILPGAMPMPFLIISLVAFWSEVNRSRSELSQIIQGEV